MQTYTNNIVLTWAVLTFTVMGGSLKLKVSGGGIRKEMGVKIRVRFLRAVWE